MKKILLLMVAAILISTSVFAMPQKGDDGISYWDGDMNYPIWDSGSHGGSCIDLSSAVLKTDNASECRIEMLDFSVNYDTDSISPIGIVQFREDKGSGRIYFKTENSKWGWQKFGFSSRTEVYYLVKEKVVN